MIAIICLCFMMVIAAYYITTRATSLEDHQATIDVVAQQLIYYHAASLRACGATCTAISPAETAAELSSFRKGQSNFASGNLKSAVSGNYVYTYYTSGGSTEEVQQMQAGVLAAVIGAKEWDTQTWIGRYDAATSKLEMQSSSYWIDPQTQEMTKATIPTLSFTATSIPDGVPMMVNRR